MVDVEKTCANCGHTQVTGDFCETCGTRMPMAPAAEPVAQTVVPAAAGAATGAAAAGTAGAGAAGAAGVAAAGAAAQAGPVTASAPAAPPPTPTPPPYTAQPQYGTPPPRRGFFERLFDFSFQEFITPTIIKALFIIAMVVIGVSVLGMIVAGFTGYGAVGIFWLIGALIWGFIALLFARVGLELVIIFFRIRDNTEEIANRKK